MHGEPPKLTASDVRCIVAGPHIYYCPVWKLSIY